MGEGDRDGRALDRVRPADLVDVPALVRLITSRAADTPSAIDRAAEQVQAVMRLLLAHHALEEGHLWVAERHTDELIAAAVWLPPEADRDFSRFHGLIVRELEVPPDLLALGRADGEALEAARAGTRDRVLLVASRDGDCSHVLLDRVLAPGLQAVDRQNCTALAWTASLPEAGRLEAFGFRDTRKVTLPSGGYAWLSSRPPAPTRTASPLTGPAAASHPPACRRRCHVGRPARGDRGVDRAGEGIARPEYVPYGLFEPVQEYLDAPLLSCTALRDAEGEKKARWKKPEEQSRPSDVGRVMSRVTENPGSHTM